MAARFASGLWRLADPKISLASIAGMSLGAAAAAARGPIHPGWLLATVLGILALEVAKNAAGEVVDLDSGDDLAVAPGDRSPFSGGKRVLVDGLLTRRQAIAIAAAYAAGIALGLLIVLAREPAVLGLGVLGTASAYAYHGPPLRLAYRGLGEALVGLNYGPLIVCGTYLVQRGAVAPGLPWVSLPLGLLIAAFLWINELPDEPADRACGKRTLVVRLGRRRAARAFVALLGLAFALAALLPLLGLPRPLWLSLLAALPAARAARLALAHPEETPRLVPAQAAPHAVGQCGRSRSTTPSPSSPTTPPPSSVWRATCCVHR